MWRFYAELFLLMVVAFAAGSAVAAVGIRLLVRQKAPGGPVADVAPPAGAPGQDGGTT